MIDPGRRAPGLNPAAIRPYALEYAADAGEAVGTPHHEAHIVSGGKNMAGEQLNLLYGLCARVMEVNTEGLTHAESLLSPEPGGNCANWVLGHIVHSREAALDLLGAPPGESRSGTERYRRGSDPIGAGEDAVGFDALKDRFRIAHERLVGRLREVTDAELLQTTEQGTVLERLLFLHFHEAYHLGQLGLLRRIAGHRGAIP